MPAVAKSLDAASDALQDAVGGVGSLFTGMSEFAPIIITGFLILTSMFNHDIKAFVWLITALFWILFVRMLQPYIGNPLKGTPCKQSPMLGTHSNPCLSSFLIIYTMAYLGTPMFLNKDWNVLAMIAFLFLFGIDAVVKTNSTCSSKWGIVNGGFIGLILGIGMSLILKAAGMDKVLYSNVGDSNKVYCSKPKEQNFKCNVYKNGSLISTL